MIEKDGRSLFIIYSYISELEVNKDARKDKVVSDSNC